MSKLNRILLCLLILSPISLIGQSLSKAQQIRFANQLMENYHPEAAQMLSMIKDLPTQFKVERFTYRSTPAANPSKWLSGKSELDVMGSMNTMVHESHHEFTGSYYLKILEENTPEDFDGNSSYRSFFLSAEEIILVRIDELYNSHELKNDIPKSLRTFRYDPYIAPRDRYLSSQVSGIYGILNEFNAYYQGTLMTLQMYPEYLSRSKRNKKTLQSFVQHIGHSYAAFYEFKYFSLMYLKRAKLRYADIYENTLSNTALREVYTKVHHRYASVINNFDNLLVKIVNDLRADGIEAEVRNGYFWIGGYGVGIMNEDVEKLKKALANPELEQIHNEFLIEGMN